MSYLKTALKMMEDSKKNKSKYPEKLKDPRWQKKRLEILERDKWTCMACGDTKNTLHVHHIFYLPNLEPWEIPNGHLITMCEDCHQIPFHNKEIIRLISILLEIIWRDQDGTLGGGNYNTKLCNMIYQVKP